MCTLLSRNNIFIMPMRLVSIMFKHNIYFLHISFMHIKIPILTNSLFYHKFYILMKYASIYANVIICNKFHSE